MGAKLKQDLGAIPSAGQCTEIRKEELLIELEKFMIYEKRYSKYNVSVIMQRMKRSIYYYQVDKLPTLDDAIRIEEDLKNQDCKPDTIRHYLRALEIMSECQGVPLELKKPKNVSRLPDILTLAECRSLRASCINARDLAIVDTLLYTGVRSKELINLDLADVDLKKRVLWIRDRGQDIKNRHERKAVITEDLKRTLDAWMKARQPVDGMQALFITQWGKRLCKDRLEKIIQENGARAGIRKRIYPHLLRHTCASTMLRSGMSISDVALQLGHRSLTSTMVYLHTDIEGLKESADKKFRY